MTDFKEYFSIDDFKKIIEGNFKRESFDSLHQSLDLFLTENKLLKPFTNHNNHVTNFGHYWEKYLNKICDEYEKKSVLEGIIDKFVFMSCHCEIDNMDPKYNKLIDKVNSGKFIPYDLPESIYDFESGESLKMMLKNWEPSLLTYIPGETWKDGGRYEVAKDEPIEKVVERQIEFKTGNLIVADWFKIQEFTKLVDENNKFDVNSEKGRLDQAKYYLENFNFIHTATWNSSEVYQNGDTFIFTRYHEDFTPPSGYKNKGNVDKELRALSIIEKEHLIELVGSEEKVEKYLKEYESGIVKLKVKPGIYTFTLASAPEFIHKEYNNLETSQTDENKDKITELFHDKNFHPTLILQGLSFKPSKKLKMK